MELDWLPPAWLCGCLETKWSPLRSSTIVFASEDSTCSRLQSRPKHSQSISAAGGFPRDLAPGATPSVGLLLDRAALQNMVAVTGARTGRGHTDISAEIGGGDRSKNWYRAALWRLSPGNFAGLAAKHLHSQLLHAVCWTSCCAEAGQRGADQLTDRLRTGASARPAGTHC